jgi:folate-binding protein YgfZ
MNTVLLENLRAARVTGPDAESFLQSQLTADLSGLSQGDSAFSAYCDRKGNVIAVMHLTRNAAGYELIAHSDLLDPLLFELRKYVLRAKVEFVPLDGKVLGDSSGATASYGVTSATAPVSQHSPQDLSDWKRAELRAGVVWLGPATSRTFLPQMLGLEHLGALSFRKGCFPGQEVIARVRYLGTLKRVPLVLELDGMFKGETGSDVELLGADGQLGTAVLVDAQSGPDGTTAFVVARIPDSAAISGISSEGEVWAGRVFPQA